MATTYKVLGQNAPVATTNTTLYTVPAATSAVISSIVIANLGLSTNIRIAVIPAGAALANQHYIFYDVPLNNNDSLCFTLGITLAATDVLTVYAGTATVAFSAYGSELS